MVGVGSGGWLAGPFERRAYTKYPDEQLTLRKVLKRFSEFEREHLMTINRTLKALGVLLHPLGGFDAEDGATVSNDDAYCVHEGEACPNEAGGLCI